jgi:hypothetical protein
MARAAANEGLQTARAYGSSAEAGKADTVTLLASLAGSVLKDAQVSASRTGTAATVTVTGHAATVIPGLSLPVSVTVTSTVERVP